MSKIKIAHVINPFKANINDESYLYYAQPITFRTMFKAKKSAAKRDISVNLYAANFKEDNDIVPCYFNKLSNLKNSTKNLFSSVSRKKKLPIIQEIFDLILKESDADYIVFTNADIAVQKKFYVFIHNLIQKNHKTIIINRRDNIPKFKNNVRLGIKHLKELYNEKGDSHQGIDCFIMKRDVLKKVYMDKMFLGYPPWGSVLYDLLRKIDPKVLWLRYNTDPYMTFHLGKDRSWQKQKNSKIRKLNFKLSKNVYIKK